MAMEVRGGSSSTFEAALRKLPSGILLVDWEDPPDEGSFRFFWANDATHVITGHGRGGVPVEEYLGKTFREAFPTLMDTPVPKLYAEAVTTGGVRELGRLDYADAVFHIVCIGLDERTAAIVYENITERVRAETTRDDFLKELRRSNDELESFAYVASHDLKSPLRDIDNLASWIAEDVADALPPASRAHFETLRGRIRRMEALLDDLLAYSRVGRVSQETSSFTARAAVESVLRLVSPPENFTVEQSLAELELRGHRAPLELVLRNLIDNAIKHHEGERGTIAVDAQPADGWMVFSVSDDGPGNNPAYHERAFGMFQTLRSRDQTGGTGMGLALVRKTVEAYGGHVELESAVGEGSTFRFTWPLAEAS